jgi:hypothetical protein
MLAQDHTAKEVVSIHSTSEEKCNSLHFIAQSCLMAHFLRDNLVRLFYTTAKSGERGLMENLLDFLI